VSDRATHATGERIADKYVLVRQLDQGGMGAVWAAENEVLDARVALKILHSNLVETEAADRLFTEAKILARLQHPGIVRALDFGRTDAGEPFVAMELLDGESLADAIDRRGRFSATDAASLLLPIVDAVSAAHEAGVVHRDIKPENIYLASVAGRTQPKVLDFGIALSQSSLRRTTNGAVMGSPAYMSPEQARGVSIDARTDIWSLAVMLQELVTGVMPFQRENYHATLRAIIEDTPPSITSLGAGDELLAAVIERALGKLPEERFPTARDFGVALAQWLFSQGVSEDVSNVSLLSSWLRVSEAPASLAPMTLTESEPPSMRDTLAPPSPHEERKEETTGSVLRRSVPALSVTAKGSTGRGRTWVLGALAGLAAIVASVYVSWPTSAPSDGTGSAAASESEPAAPTRAAAPSEVPAPVPATPRAEGSTDAGAKSVPAPRSAPTKTRKPAGSRPRPFRPRGI
jgi:serine/threonine protein kinase